MNENPAVGERALLRRLVNALDDAEGNRGVFSTCDYHDMRCPKQRADSADKWKGKWVCECYREELDSAVDAARAFLDRPTPPAPGGGSEEGET